MLPHFRKKHIYKVTESEVGPILGWKDDKKRSFHYLLFLTKNSRETPTTNFQKSHNYLHEAEINVRYLNLNKVAQTKQNLLAVNIRKPTKIDKNSVSLVCSHTRS